MAKYESRQRSDNRKTFSDNLRLRRENARLKKIVQRLYGAINSMTYSGFVAEDIDLNEKEEAIQTVDKCCPKCNSNKIGELDLGRHQFLFCSACSWRERKPEI